MSRREVTIRDVKRLLRKASHTEAKLNRDNVVTTSGFWVEESTIGRRPITVYYRFKAGDTMKARALIQLMERYQEGLHASPPGFYAGVHVGFPCSFGGIHVCIDRGEKRHSRR
jgi:hypothetical protein